jgi:calcineurin-like phosphoesterase family protein
MKIVLENNQKLFFTSDTHFGHSNICRATTTWEGAENLTRDFPSLEAMNDALVNGINNKVGQNDILIHLGDWSFGGFENIQKFRDRIVCKNIHLILGNHDHHIMNNRNDVQQLFLSVDHYKYITVVRPNKKQERHDKFRFILCHFPIASWHDMNQDVIHLHGHVHLPSHLRVAEGKAMDVGVDGNGLEPISLDEVLSIMKNRPIKKLSLPKDHHEKRI